MVKMTDRFKKLARDPATQIAASPLKIPKPESTLDDFLYLAGIFSGDEMKGGSTS